MLRVSLSLVSLLLLGSTVVAQVFVRIDPRHTYLRRNSDNAPEPTAIALSSVGIAPGQVVRIRRLGDFDNGPGGDTFGTTLAVFSNGSTLLAANLLARVPGALEAGCDVQSSPTWYSSLDTNIPEDFLVASGAGSTATQDDVIVVVPAAATHVFVCAHDSLYYDNSDPDGDYGVEFSVLAPTAWTQLGGGVGGVAGVPRLAATGELVCGAGVTFTLTNAPSNAPVLHVIGFSRVDLPLFGGVLVPNPAIAEVFVSTDASGVATLPVPIGTRLASGAALYVQAWLIDPTAPFGFAASGAVRGIVP